MNNTNSPIYGTNPKKIHQPDLPISCNLRTRSAKHGIKDIAINIPIPPKPNDSDCAIIPNAKKANNTIYVYRTNYQYSERVALPENVPYFA